jgi:uncharacterized membrane protein YdjX (TVP38/TMEM64 family)
VPILALAAIGLVIFQWRLPLPLAHYILAALTWAESLGPWGPAAFAALCVLAAAFCISGTLMILAAGFLFGWLGGAITASVGTTLGAIAPFLLARTCLRGWVERKLVGHPKLSAIDDVANTKGLRVVFLMRLTSAPSVLVNYLFGVTRVKFWPYLLGTWLGMIPRIVLFTYLGSLAHSIADIRPENLPAHPILTAYFAIGLAVTMVVVLFVGYFAHRALKGAVTAGREKT